MVLAGHGDPHTKTPTNVTHQQLLNLLPPLCPSKVFTRRELLYQEGEVDSTFYLLQKGEALLRFECPTDGRSKVQTGLETLKGGDTFGEMEMMIEADGTVLPRATSCECLSPRCEVIAIDDHLFSLLTDVFDSTHSALRKQATMRCKKVVDKWADNLTVAQKKKYRRYEPLWMAGKKEAHRLFVVKDGFLEVEMMVEDPLPTAVAAAAGAAAKTSSSSSSSSSVPTSSASSSAAWGDSRRSSTKTAFAASSSLPSSSSLGPSFAPRPQHKMIKHYGPGTYVDTKGKPALLPSLPLFPFLCPQARQSPHRCPYPSTPFRFQLHLHERE